MSASAIALIGLAPRFLPWLLNTLSSAPSSIVIQSTTAFPDRDANTATANGGDAIVNSGTGTVNHSDDHSNRSQHNSGNRSGDNKSISISGSKVTEGAVINSGDGNTINSNNDSRSYTFHGNVNEKAVKALTRPTKLTPQQFVSRYIDASSGRIPDRPSVALHVLNIEGFETTGIQDAAGAALMDRGYHVMNLFRAPFSDDGLDKELFRGSAKLADQLQLQQHCDRVLLGEVQLKAANNLQGLFITEASISLHQITVESGAVDRNIVIRAKGSGLNADASAASALRELEESIKQQLGEWTLT